ncbi:MAG TPA: anti-sigma factor [Vicinamibacterales bacterium]|nr:anti-sigma factor [Vicinamibacterales bacterium]
MDAEAPRPAPRRDAPPDEEQSGRIEATVGQLERLCGRLEQAEQHFKRLTDECETVLQGLVAVDRRHSGAIASLNERLGDWCNLEGKLLEESSRRIERFERGVSHEWMVLRRLNEEPIAELREQAEALRRTCLEAARLARLRLDTAERSYASHAEEIERRLAEWTHRLLPPGGSGGPSDTPEPWSFEGVAQLHQDVRNAGPGTRGGDDGGGDPEASPHKSVPHETEPNETAPHDDGGPKGSPHKWALAAGGVGLVSLMVFLVLASGRPQTMSTTLPGGVAAYSAADPPGDSPDEGQAAVKRDAAAQDERLLEAQRAAEHAALMVDILAAPDLLRYALAGAGTRSAAYAQVLWSRTRGMAITASRLPAAPPGSAYQVWIGNEVQLAPAGALTPDATGRASLVVPGPLTLPRLGRIRITLEPEGGSPQPSGELCLAGGPTA